LSYKSEPSKKVENVKDEVSEHIEEILEVGDEDLEEKVSLLRRLSFVGLLKDSQSRTHFWIPGETKEFRKCCC